MLIFALAVVIQTSLAKIQKVQLAIHEGNANFKEKIFVDELGRYEIIKVPKHNNVIAMDIFVDYKMGYKIYKRYAEKLCLVMDLAKDEVKPQELVDGVKKVKGKFPESRHMIENEHILPIGKVDADSKRGKSSAQFCGKDYRIQKAVAYIGEDLDGFITQQFLNGTSRNDEEEDDSENGEKMLKNLMNLSNTDTSPAKSMQSKRDTVVVHRWDVNCCGGHNVCMATMVKVLNQCNGIQSKIKGSCRITKNPLGCVYRVLCPYNTASGRWHCTTQHRYTSLVCCDFKCNMSG